MTVGRRGHRSAAALVSLVLVALAVLAGLPAAARAQFVPRAEVQIIPDLPNLPAAPTIVGRAFDIPPERRPVFLVLQVNPDPTFSGDRPDVLTRFVRATDTISVVPDSLLPNRVPLYFRLSVFDAQNNLIVRSPVLGPRTSDWLELVSPSGFGASLTTTRPLFQWSSAFVDIPPGPWEYLLQVTNLATGLVDYQARTTQTFDSIPANAPPLETNTPYRWSVTARTLGGNPRDSITVSSAQTFIVTPSNRPLATLLYQNFPNPFPSATQRTTCIWFDLAEASAVRLTVHDLRGNLVRVLVPSGLPGSLPGDLPAGSYGRAGVNAESGCAPDLRWDGTAQNGRMVPPGVYLLRLQAGGKLAWTKMLWLGEGGGR